MGAGFDADFPLTGVSMMAIWVTAVLHRHFPAVRETPDFKGLLRPQKQEQRIGLGDFCREPS
jgi:hypothetical protein